MVNLFKRKPRVLVLDDDVSMQKLVSVLLKRDGYSVEVVSSGRAAIDAVEKEAYAALLLDLMMPNEGGITVLKHLRDSNPAMLQKVILLTATPDSVIKTIAGDVFAVVKKPFEGEDLVAAVRRLA